jgi:hypothetical protein
MSNPSADFPIDRVVCPADGADTMEKVPAVVARESGLSEVFVTDSEGYTTRRIVPTISQLGLMLTAPSEPIRPNGISGGQIAVVVFYFLLTVPSTSSNKFC